MSRKGRDLFDENMPQMLDSGRVPIDRMFPSDRNTLWRTTIGLPTRFRAARDLDQSAK